MNLKEKTWIWKLTFPFAHDNFTTIGETLYHPHGVLPSQWILEHEAIHSQQMLKVGLLKYLFLYLMAMPILWNKFRFQWEFDAYTIGSKYSEDKTIAILRSYKYGWLRNR